MGACVAAALAAVTAAFGGAPAAPDVTRVVVETTAGPIAIELFARQAPATVARFLARAGLAPAPAGVPGVAPYAGSQLCDSRAHGYLMFGCLPYALDGPRPKAPGVEPPTPDEIDASALGLGSRAIDDPRTVEWLWSQEVFPHYAKLAEAGRPVPPGLARLVESIETGGMEKTRELRGKSWLWYLETLGYRFRDGASSARVERGSVTTTNLYPGEADERFLIALTDIPERDGRSTVFGRVVGGWEAIAAIEKIPVDKSHRPLEPVLIRRIVSAGDRSEGDER